MMALFIKDSGQKREFDKERESVYLVMVIIFKEIGLTEFLVLRED
jgi:hypothetical protein